METIYHNKIGSIKREKASAKTKHPLSTRYENFFDNTSRALKVFVVASHLTSSHYQYNQYNKDYSLASSTSEAFTKLLENMNPEGYEGDLAYYYKFFSYNTNPETEPGFRMVKTLKDLSTELGGFHHHSTDDVVWESWSDKLIDNISNHKIMDLHFEANEGELINETQPLRVTVNGKLVETNSYYKLSPKKVAFKARKYRLPGGEKYIPLKQGDKVVIKYTPIE